MPLRRGESTDRLTPPISPVLRFLGRLIVLAVDTVRPAPLPHGEANGEPDPNLEAIYARNIRTISVINRQRGIRTVWIGELLDPAQFTGLAPDAEPWAPFVPADAGWRLLSHLRNIVRSEAAALGDVYIDVPVEEFTESDFADGEHFASPGSLKFADLVAPKIAEICRKGE